MKKFLAALLICGEIFILENSADAAVAKIYNTEKSFQFLGTFESYRYGYVVNCNEWISLRREPSVYSERICKIPLGARVTVHWGKGDFYKVYYYDGYTGHEGYVLKQYIDSEW